MRISPGRVIGRTARIGFLLAIPILFSACHLGEKRVVKSQGLCLVSETAEPVTVNALSSKRAAGYLPQTTFGPEEQPMAVVVGYGGKSASVELADGTGHLLGTKTLDSNPGETSFQPLQIETSGEYELRLLVDGVQRDTCKFSVTRNLTPAPANANAPDASSLPGTAIPASSAQSETYFPDYDVNLRSRMTSQQSGQLLNVTNEPNGAVKTVK